MGGQDPRWVLCIHLVWSAGEGLLEVYSEAKSLYFQTFRGSRGMSPKRSSPAPVECIFTLLFHHPIRRPNLGRNQRMFLTPRWEFLLLSSGDCPYSLGYNMKNPAAPLGSHGLVSLTHLLSFSLHSPPWHRNSLQFPKCQGSLCLANFYPPSFSDPRLWELSLFRLSQSPIFSLSSDFYFTEFYGNFFFIWLCPLHSSLLLP